jgi:hypothetical protein
MRKIDRNKVKVPQAFAKKAAAAHKRLAALLKKPRKQTSVPFNMAVLEMPVLLNALRKLSVEPAPSAERR